MDSASPKAASPPGTTPGRRKRETRRSVLIVDRIADWSIRIGGLMVIVAVFGIMAFLVEVVIPLFTGGSVGGVEQRTLPTGERPVLTAGIDEYQTIAATISDDGVVRMFHLQSGRALGTQRFELDGKTVSAFSRTVLWEDLAFGFSDGTVRFGRLSIASQIVPAEQMPTGLTRLDDRDQTDGVAIYSEIPGNQYRKVAIAIALEDEQKISDRPITAVDYHLGGTTERPTKTFLTVDAAGVARLSIAESRMNIMTRRLRTTVATSEMPALPAGTRIARAITTEKGDQVYIVDSGGNLYRFDTRDMNAPRLAETRDLLPGNAEITAFGFLLGEQSLVVGGSDGSVDVYFRLARSVGLSNDGFTMVRAHRLEPHKSAVAAFSPSQRGKMLVTADRDGAVWVRHSTSEQTLLKLDKQAATDGYQALLLSPREDGVVAIDRTGRTTFWRVSIPHPETTFGTIFGKVWYEGYDQPTYTWQSSAGTDSFEPKLSLVPLIFGTIKATVYALLFAVPIALLAAVYTSEFVHSTVRATVKPVMEMMASLPSVVLGFVAALILAPIVETWIAAVLMVFVAVPLTFLISAYLWQLLPHDTALRLQGLPKFGLMFVVLALGFYFCSAAGGVFERLFFAGDLKAWANGDVGSPLPFVFLMLLPLSAVAVVLAERSLVGDMVQQTARQFIGVRAGLFDFARWLILFGLACLFGLALAALLTGLGYDPRGGVVGTYVQRNTLIVGFAMGFAVIPIIYTIAEDALNAVPEHLRAASLACGATSWQTATRVILPTAISGVFAAIMIGMGRAVGETMIVVMAAGNTPILEWNVFNGLRALSANIAVELPEAVKDGTLFRMLFLAALTLFVMTFVVNTLAEIIRQRFRRRAVQL